MATLNFKLTKQDCEDIIRNKPEQVYQVMGDSLTLKLSQETDLVNIYRIQGEINMLMQISGLKQKAQAQINE